MANFAWKFEFFLNCLKNQILGKICLRIEFVLVQLLKETDIFRKFAWTNRNFLVKLPEKIRNFRKFTRKNRNFWTRIHEPPDFKPD